MGGVQAVLDGLPVDVRRADLIRRKLLQSREYLAI